MSRIYKLSRGEICVANFIPPANGASLGSQNWTFLSYFASPEIIEVKICNRQTERQILWHHIKVCVDFFFKLNLLPPYSLYSQGDKKNSLKLFHNKNFFPRPWIKTRMVLWNLKNLSNWWRNGLIPEPWAQIRKTFSEKHSKFSTKTETGKFQLMNWGSWHFKLWRDICTSRMEYYDTD